MHFMATPSIVRTMAYAVLSLALPAIFLSCVTSPPSRAATTLPPAPAVQQAKAPSVSAAPPQPAKPAAQPSAKPPVASSSPVSAAALGLYRDPVAAKAPPTVDELSVIASAKLLLGQVPNARVTVNGRQFTLDCIGTVEAIFWRMNIDVAKDFDKYPGNGVNRLYLSLEKQGVLHKDRYPRPGDVVFWDNTWDANGDGNRTNDLHTHAGVVLAVDDDGTIYYVHENLSKGVMIEVMNLLTPALASDASGKRINNTMAIATVSGGPRPERYFSGDVWSRFGDILKVKAHYLAAAAFPDGDRTPILVATAALGP